MKKLAACTTIAILGITIALLAFNSVFVTKTALAGFPVLTLPPPAPNGSTIISFSSNPAPLVPGNDVTITTTTSSLTQPTHIDEGRVTIQLATDALGVPVPAGSVVTWVSLNPPGQNPVGGVTTLDVDLDALGFLPGTIGGFRAHYVTGGGSNHVDTHFSAAVDLGATSSTSCSGLTIGATLAVGDGCPLPGPAGPWTFRITVQNCTGMDLSAVKVQGGANGWAGVTGISATAGSFTVSTKQKNSVITWTVDVPNAATVYIEVTVNGNIPPTTPAGQIRFLSGPWSAVYDDDGDSLTPRVKTDYTGRVSLTVGPCVP